MHRFANPARFLILARTWGPWCGWLGLALMVGGLGGGLLVTPPDYLQGQLVRILYVHVPAAWLGMAGWMGIAGASLMALVWRHPLAHVAARACAGPGAVFAAICLLTGSIWGRPAWGTWWDWDGRLTSMLLLFFLYLGYMALERVTRDAPGGERLAALFGLSGAINLPVIHYSVLWWRTLHQGQSIGLTGSTIAPSLLWPLPITFAGFSLLFGWLVLLRMRAMLADAKADARLRRLAAA